MKNDLPNVFLPYDTIEVVRYKATGFPTVEYCPKQLLDDSERNYREMLNTMTAFVEWYKAGKDLAIDGLKEILLCWPEYNSGLTAKRYLEKLGEL